MYVCSICGSCICMPRIKYVCMQHCVCVCVLSGGDGLDDAVVAQPPPVEEKPAEVIQIRRMGMS